MAKLEGVKVIDIKDGEVTKISYEGVEYTKVETEAMSGDIIRYIDDYEDTPSTDFFKVKGDQYVDNSGTTLSINGWGGHHKYTTFSNHGNQSDIEDRISALETRVDALEKVGVGIKSAQAGDIIRITYGLGNRIGEEMTVASVSTSGDVIRVEETDERLNIGEIEFEVIGCKEKPKFAEGDYVKVIGETVYGDITEGSYAKIIELSPYDNNIYKIELIDGSEYDFALTHYLKKVELNDGDLSFIRAGREPGETITGDLVRVKDACRAPLKEGEIYEVGSPSNSRFSTIVTDAGWFVTVSELVAPASARVDIDA